MYSFRKYEETNHELFCATYLVLSVSEHDFRLSAPTVHMLCLFNLTTSQPVGELSNSRQLTFTHGWIVPHEIVERMTQSFYTRHCFDVLKYLKNIRMLVNEERPTVSIFLTSIDDSMIHKFHSKTSSA